VSAQLNKALRQTAQNARDASTSYDEIEGADERAIKDAAELACVLARILDGKSVYEAFGAPGDWGYEMPIGNALAVLYREQGAALPMARLAAPAMRRMQAGDIGLNS
jgi:hypothetical protein